MSKPILMAFLQNTAILFMLAVIFVSFGYRWIVNNTWWKKIILGFFIGGIGILVMNSPWYFGNGLYTDARSVIISLSGLFFGAVPTIIAMIVASVYRYFMGGAILTGITLIVVTGTAGIVWRILHKKSLENITWWQLSLFGIMIHLFMIAIIFTQPLEVALPFFKTIALPIIVVYPASTMILGLLMRNHLRHERINEEIEKTKNRLKSMVDILQYPADEVQSFVDFAMEEAVKLTDSKLGFIFYYSEETELLTLSAWSKEAMEECRIPSLPRIFELKKAGIWGEPVRQRQPIIVNNFQEDNPLKKGYPAGHPEILRLLEIPVFMDDRIVAVVGMANKINEYTEIDVAELSLMMDTVWKTTERKKALEDLRLSEENHRLMFAQKSDGIFIITPEGELLEVNESGCEMLGFSQEELMSNYHSNLKSIDPQFFLDMTDCDVSQGQTNTLERVITNRNNEYFYIEILTQILSDGRVLKEIRNITERKKAEEAVIQAQRELRKLLRISDDSRKALLSVIEDQKDIEEALRKSEISYRNLFENITQGFALHRIVVNEAGIPINIEVLAVNPAYEKLTGLKADQLVGKFIKDLIVNMNPKWFKIYGDVALTGKPAHIEDYISSIGKYCEISAFSPEFGYFAVVISDITERKNIEEEREQFNQELESRVKQRTMELEMANHELESFSYSVSHDLRAPLRSINGFSEIILDEYAGKLDSEVTRYFGLIRKNATMMGNLVDDLLNFSRLGRQALTKVSTNPNAIVKEILDSMHADILTRGIKIVLHKMPSCEADPNLIRQVYTNLISNSIKFTRTASNPVIEIGYKTDCKRGGETCPCYFVKDNGVGFDMKFYDKLFGVFQRLHRYEDYEGTGVGLAIVQRIISKHGGTIWAKAAVGKGATFYFTLGAPNDR